MVNYVIIYCYLTSIMINWSIWLDFWNWVFSNLGFLLKLYVQVNCWFLKCHWTLLNALEHASCVYIVHASFRLFFSFFYSNLVWCNLPLGFLCFLSLIFFLSILSKSLASWLGRLEPIRHPPPPLLQLLIVRGFVVRNTKRILRNSIS